MCIALYIPTGKTITEQQIRNSFGNNPDGAGVMHYDRNGDVIYAKGFMDVESLLAYWKHNTTSKYPRAIHCRIATSGKISKGCCHPFPITDNLDTMLEPRGKSKTGCLIHNGVFARYTPVEGMKSLYSDTMYFTQKVIYPLRQVLDNSGVDELMADMTSRVLVFLPNYEVHRYGKWEYEKENGFYASNSTYDYSTIDWKKYTSAINTTTTTTKPYYYGTDYGWSDDDYWSFYHGCYKPKADTTHPKKRITDQYGVMFSAHSSYEADVMVETFINEFKDVVIDGGWDAFDTLVSYGESEWLFYIFTSQEISIELNGSPYVVFEHTKFDENGNIVKE